MKLKKPIKTFKAAGKTVKVYNKKKIPSKKVIKNVFSKLPDDTKIPLEFMSRKQYLNNYIVNQEKKNNIDFTPKQEKNYVKQEMKQYNNIAARYTTKKNPYKKPAIVVFNDKPMNNKQFKFTMGHEVKHELLERNGNSMGGQKEEMVCDRYAANFVAKDNSSKNMGFRHKSKYYKDGTKVKYFQDEGTDLYFEDELDKKTQKKGPGIYAYPNYGTVLGKNIINTDDEDTYRFTPGKDGNLLDIKPIKKFKTDEEINKEEELFLGPIDESIWPIEDKSSKNYKQKKFTYGGRVSNNENIPKCKTCGKTLYMANRKGYPNFCPEHFIEEDEDSLNMDYVNSMPGQDGFSRNLTVKGRLADKALLKRTMHPKYEHDSLLLPFGHSKDINNNYKNVRLMQKESYLDEASRDELAGKISYRRKYKDDLSLIENDLKISPFNYDDDGNDIREDEESKNMQSSGISNVASGLPGGSGGTYRPTQSSGGITTTAMGLSQKRPTPKVVINKDFNLSKYLDTEKYIITKDAEGKITEIKSKPEEYVSEDREYKWGSRATKNKFNREVLKFDKGKIVSKQVFDVVKDSEFTNRNTGRDTDKWQIKLKEANTYDDGYFKKRDFYNTYLRNRSSSGREHYDTYLNKSMDYNEGTGLTSNYSEPGRGGLVSQKYFSTPARQVVKRRSARDFNAGRWS